MHYHCLKIAGNSKIMHHNNALWDRPTAYYTHFQWLSLAVSLWHILFLFHRLSISLTSCCRCSSLSNRLRLIIDSRSSSCVISSIFWWYRTLCCFIICKCNEDEEMLIYFFVGYKVWVSVKREGLSWMWERKCLQDTVCFLVIIRYRKM